MTRIEQVLDFWLREVGPDRWYDVDPALDAEITRRFGALANEAACGKLERWGLTPRGNLALLILLDQFPRNIRRGQAAAFAADRRALGVAKRAIRLGYDRLIPEPERQFFYLPLMHSETNADQDRCVRLMITRMVDSGPDNLRHAVAHREVIRRFGRFPFRNAALGRADTPAERAWLAEGGYRA
jgi:uncharacterized protein (DUF924 family)